MFAATKPGLRLNGLSRKRSANAAFRVVPGPRRWIGVQESGKGEKGPAHGGHGIAHSPDVAGEAMGWCRGVKVVRPLHAPSLWALHWSGARCCWGNHLGVHHEDQGLQDLFVTELHSIYNAENQLLKALPKMARAATNPD